MTGDRRNVSIKTSDGCTLVANAVGQGTPVVFVHEYSGDMRSWEPQVAALSARHRCITFCARGYPPSQIPDSVAAYNQQRAADDVIDVMNALEIAQAGLVGLSMGGFATLHVAIRHPERVSALVVSACGYGAKPEDQAAYLAAMNAEADRAERVGMAAYADELAGSEYARLLRAKNEGAWQLFRDQLAEHSAKGMAMTLRGVLGPRPSLWHLEAQLRAIVQPTLLVIGDEDRPCLEPNLFMKDTLPDCALAILPRTGHLPNLEEPETFNGLIDRFFTSVADGRWHRMKSSITKA